MQYRKTCSVPECIPDLLLKQRTPMKSTVHTIARQGRKRADFQHLIEYRRNLYNRIKLFCKADNKVIDVRVNAEDSNKYRKDNHCYRNKRKENTNA